MLRGREERGRKGKEGDGERTGENTPEINSDYTALSVCLISPGAAGFLPQ